MPQANEVEHPIVRQPLKAADTQVARLLKPDIHKRVRDEQSREQRREYADAQREREALHASYAELKHYQAREQRGYVRIEYDGVCPIETREDRGVGVRARLQLLTNALVDEDICVHRHADCQQDAANA